MSHHHTRRDFLHQLGLGCASVGATSLLSTITNMGLVNAAVAANRSVYQPVNTGYKALVCIMLSGGNDSYNMLAPKGDTEWQEYSDVRTNLAIDKDSLLEINPTNNIGKELGLHPNLQRVQSLFETGNAAFIANVGAMVGPTTKEGFQSGINLPLGLFSHSDQRLHWQTSIPQDRNANGWGGRLADILHTNNANENISMNISLNGVNTYQRGNIISEYAIEPGNGSVNLNGSSNNQFYQSMKRQTLDSILEVSYQNIFEKAYSESIGSSIENSVEFSTHINNVAPFQTVTFGQDSLGERLEMVAKVIAARSDLQMNSQTFFVQQSGYDNHDNNILDHGNLMAQLDESLGDFWDALVELGIEDDVLVFTASDFARKLVSNGDGSDHAWGGHALVMGGAVNGRQIFGEYPDLYIGNGLDVGNGRILPTTSCDEFFAEMALWMGASSAAIPDILPNINNFWTPSATEMPLGFLPPQMP